MKLTPAKNKVSKLMYLSLGIIFLVIGVIGLLLPVLPGWLFLIPAIFCFAKGSLNLNNWLGRRKSLKKYFSQT
jgi:uncharacterized protein